MKREPGIASQQDGGDRWSTDHVFLDQDGIPTLVEVKRTSDLPSALSTRSWAGGCG